MILEKSKIKYKLTVTKSEFEDIRNLYGSEGNIELFFEAIWYNTKLGVFELYFDKFEYKFYKRLLKESKKNEQKSIRKEI